MKTAGILGIVLIVLGALGLALRGFEYTRQEQVLDVGPIEASVEERERVTIPVWISGLVLAAGLALVIAGRKNTA